LIVSTIFAVEDTENTNNDSSIAPTLMVKYVNEV